MLTRACPGVFGFIHGRWVHSRAPFGSSGFVGFTRVGPDGRWVVLRLLGSLAYALGVVRFIRSNWVIFRTPLGSSSSSGNVGYASARPGGRWDHP